MSNFAANGSWAFCSLGDEGTPCPFVPPELEGPAPTGGREVPNAFGVPTGSRHRAGMGPPRADVGRCEAHGALPRPPPQPAGPTGPLGSRPAHLAPWRAAQAPTPRPIRPLAGSAGLVGGRSCGHIWVLCDLPTRQRRVWAASVHPGIPGGGWGRPRWASGCSAGLIVVLPSRMACLIGIPPIIYRVEM